MLTEDVDASLRASMLPAQIAYCHQVRSILYAACSLHEIIFYCSILSDTVSRGHTAGGLAVYRVCSHRQHGVK